VGGLLDVLWQRHTCRAGFDLQKKVAERDLQYLLCAARRAPTAHNLRVFELIVIGLRARRRIQGFTHRSHYSVRHPQR
jgi:nitroreductase